MNCSIEGCHRPSVKRTWCATHYARWRAHGDPHVTKKAPNGAGYMHLGYVGHQIDGVRKFDHVRIAEKALGRELPPGTVVHHVNEIKSDNRPENLVICPDRAYHNLIHARTDALNACGNANWRQCRVCKKYDDLANLRVYERGTTSAFWHRDCLNERGREINAARTREQKDAWNVKQRQRRMLVKATQQGA